MTTEERLNLIDFIIDAIWEVEGHQLNIVEIAELTTSTDDELLELADWYDYLLDK